MDYLFTTPNCPKCPAFKERVAEKGYSVREMTPLDPEFLDRAREYGIQSVPALVLGGQVFTDISTL